MSVSVYVNAIKELSEEELFLIKSYNTLVRNGLTIPEDLQQRLFKIVGSTPDGYHDSWDTPYELRSKTVEIYVQGDGWAESGDGKIIQMEDIPEGTKALRIYMG